MSLEITDFFDYYHFNESKHRIYKNAPTSAPNCILS